MKAVSLSTEICRAHLNDLNTRQTRGVGYETKARFAANSMLS